MTRNTGEMTITLPVLDRLIDLEPKSEVENPLSRAQSVRLLKSAVRRDLEWLVNTRRIADPLDEGFKEIDRSEIGRSVYLYGLPDLSSLSVATSADRSKVERQVLATINLFEPRLTKVRLVPLDTPGGGGKDIRLRIEAVLRMDPVPEPVSFDTVIELKSGNCRLSGSGDAR